MKTYTWVVSVFALVLLLTLLLSRGDKTNPLQEQVKILDDKIGELEDKLVESRLKELKSVYIIDSLEKTKAVVETKIIIQNRKLNEISASPNLSDSLLYGFFSGVDPDTD